jgi:Tol biopolymer transport system component
VPERLSELATEALDEDPWVSPDGRVIYFSSERSGNREIYAAER